MKFKMKRQINTIENGVLLLSELIDADSFLENRDVIEVTDVNFNLIKEDYPYKKYTIGDSFIGPLKSISFWVDDEEICRVKVFADPYYELSMLEDDKWVILDRHRDNPLYK